MLAGEITVDAWERAFMAQIKSRTIQLYQLGKPGQLDQTDRGKLGNQIRYQYDKLWNFRQAIVNGDLSEAQIKYRAELYFNKTRWAHEEGKRRSHYVNGYMWERRIRQAVESCVECIAIAAMGWQAINTLNRIGEACSCQANCKCKFVYSDSVVMPENSTQDILNQIQLSWINQGRGQKAEGRSMKITFDSPDIDAPPEILDNAVKLAKSAFNKALSNDAGEVMAADEIIEKSYLDFGHPTPEQLEKMNRYRPKGSKEYKAEDVISAVFMASNNLLFHSREAWSINALEQMSAQFAGRVFTLNHDWWDVKEIKGLIYDTELVRSNEVPKSILDKVDYDINLNIFKKDGYVQLYLFAMFEADHPFVKDMYFRRSDGGVSTGTFIDPNKMMCPHDGSYFGEGEYSYQCKHGHNMPNEYLMAFWYENEELENLADYVVFDCNIDSVELSSVVQGNLPAARILT